MNKLISRAIALFLVIFMSVAAFAGGSSPGLYYGQVPTAAQWNSYFAAKLDYTPGAANTITYWDGSGNLLNAPVAGDCTMSAGFFTCSTAHATSLYGGTTGAVPYQAASGVTAFLSGNTTTTPQFLTSTGTGAAAQAPILTGSTGSGSVVLSTGASLTSISSMTQAWTVTAASGTAVSGTLYAVNTSSVPVTITLPASAANATATMLDYAGTFATHNLTINAPTGVNINGVSGSPASLTVSSSWVKIICTYLDATIGYRCYQ